MVLIEEGTGVIPAQVDITATEADLGTLVIENAGHIHINGTARFTGKRSVHLNTVHQVACSLDEGEIVVLVPQYYGRLYEYASSDDLQRLERQGFGDSGEHFRYWSGRLPISVKKQLVSYAARWVITECGLHKVRSTKERRANPEAKHCAVEGLEHVPFFEHNELYERMRLVPWSEK